MNTIKAILESSQGQFMTVTFTKKDGSLRTITGRSGVTKYLKGGQRTTSPDKFFCIFENGSGYRSINYDTVSRVAIGGKVIEVSPAK